MFTGEYKASWGSKKGEIVWGSWKGTIWNEPWNVDKHLAGEDVGKISGWEQED